MSDDALSQMAASFTNGVVRKNSTLGGSEKPPKTTMHPGFFQTASCTKCRLII